MMGTLWSLPYGMPSVHLPLSIPSLLMGRTTESCSSPSVGEMGEDNLA